MKERVWRVMRLRLLRAGAWSSMPAMGGEVLQLADLAAEFPAGPDGALVGLVAGEQVGPHERGGVELDGRRRGQQRREGGLQPDQPGAEAEGEEVEGALLDVGVGEAAAGVGADQLGLDTEVAGDGADVRLGGFEELGFLGGDADGLEAGAGAEDGDVAAAAVGETSSRSLSSSARLGLMSLVGGEDAWGVAPSPKNCAAYRLGGDAEADGLAGVLDGGQAEDLAGGGERLDVPDAGGVDLLAVDAPDDPVVDLDTDPLRGEQLDLGWAGGRRRRGRR